METININLIDATAGVMTSIINMRGILTRIPALPEPLRVLRNDVGQLYKVLPSLQRLLAHPDPKYIERTTSIPVEDFAITLAQIINSLSELQPLVRKLAKQRDLIGRFWWPCHNVDLHLHMYRFEVWTECMELMLKAMQSDSKLEATRYMEKVRKVVKRQASILPVVNEHFSQLQEKARSLYETDWAETNVLTETSKDVSSDEDFAMASIPDSASCRSELTGTTIDGSSEGSFVQNMPNMRHGAQYKSEPVTDVASIQSDNRMSRRCLTWTLKQNSIAAMIMLPFKEQELTRFCLLLDYSQPCMKEDQKMIGKSSSYIRHEREFAALTEDFVPDCRVRLVRHNYLEYWLVTINGPEDSPYKGGIFSLKVTFPGEYPFKMPHFRFLTRIYHPNIKSDGSIEVMDFRKYWNPGLRVGSILISILWLLKRPAPSEIYAAEPEISRIFRDDRAAFTTTAQFWTKQFASSEMPHACLAGYPPNGSSCIMLTKATSSRHF